MIEDGAQEVADRAPKSADAASKRVEGAAQAVQDNARPAADKASDVIEDGARKVNSRPICVVKCEPTHAPVCRQLHAVGTLGRRQWRPH